MIIQTIMFYVLAVVTVGAGVMVIASRNPVHSVLFLILAFFNSAGLFVMMGAEFLAMILIIVYVGAVAVLFLFVVMMLDINFAELRAGFLQYLPIGGVVGVILLAELVMVFASGVIEIEVPMNVASPTPPPDEISNTQALGNVLYTRYAYLFQGAGFILLIAMVGAIVLTHRRRADVRRQRIAGPGGARSQGCRSAHRHQAGRGGDMEIGLTHYLTVAAVLFTLGVVGIFLNRKNVIIILMAIELMLLAVNINLVAFSTYLNDMVGQVFAMLVLTVAAAEAAIGPRHPGRLFPQSRQYRRRGRQRDEGLRARALLRCAHLPAALRGGDRRACSAGLSARARRRS